MDIPNLILLFAAAVVAGAINSVAGGGTLISFPSLLTAGVPAILANATNTAALVPGSASSAFAYREEIRTQGRLLITLFIPSALGGVLGAIALVVTPPEIFNYIVPFLVLFATLLFAGRDLFNRLAGNDTEEEKPVTWIGNIWGVTFQILVAAYGGYFGAGIGILMLASLSIMGLRDIHRMNGVKTVLAVAINGVALVVFIIEQKVVWSLAILMAVGAIIGGYGGARLAKRVNQNAVRGFVIVVGLIVSVYLFARLL
ncbi:MAG: sulfite exporter TauE/SafE family protein [Candidatus Roseilinea sp.]|uniref:sulfite exporter TauE/SafE family protein n=1 Tax=Candidatus Roseilinea sp. TaxID=2838777 RepID=UPI00404A21D3